MEEKQKREEILYLYVKEFIYKDTKYGEMMGGHPEPGRIYRALYDTESKLYRLLFENEIKDQTGVSGIIMSRLTPDDPRFSAEITIIDDDSILDYDIMSEDYIKLAAWKDCNNEDIDHLRIERANDIEIDEGGTSHLTFDSIDKITVGDDEITEHIQYLAELDMDLVTAINKSIESIIYYLQSGNPAEPDITKPITRSLKHGKGINLGLAIEALSEYLNNDKPSSKGSLTKAVYYLLREVARINKKN